MDSPKEVKKKTTPEELEVHQNEEGEIKGEKSEAVQGGLHVIQRPSPAQEPIA